MNLNLEISKKVFLEKYYPYLWDYSYRYNVYWGGRASGKTFFIIQKLLLKGLKEKRNILLMQKRNNAVKDTVGKELTLAIDRFKLTDYFILNRSEYRATCTINGTEFRCIGLDEPEKIKGYANVSDVYLDEVTAFTVDDVELIDGTLRSKEYSLPLQMYFSFNPVSKANFVYKYGGFDTGIVPENTFILHSTYLDNPKADAYQRMEALKARNPARYKIEALGEFCSLDKLVYNNGHIEEFYNSDIDGDLIIGLDFGFVNDNTALIASIVKDKSIYIFKEYICKGKTNDEIAAAIKSLGFSKSFIIADSAEPKSVEELRRLGIYRIKESIKGPDSIVHGIQKLQQYDFIVHPSCTETITELENYSWQKDRTTGEYINKPIDDFNHTLDALRYSLQCLDKHKLQSINKNVLGL